MTPYKFLTPIPPGGLNFPLSSNKYSSLLKQISLLSPSSNSDLVVEILGVDDHLVGPLAGQPHGEVGHRADQLDHGKPVELGALVVLPPVLVGQVEREAQRLGLKRKQEPEQELRLEQEQELEN